MIRMQHIKIIIIILLVTFTGCGQSAIRSYNIIDVDIPIDYRSIIPYSNEIKVNAFGEMLYFCSGWRGDHGSVITEKDCITQIHKIGTDGTTELVSTIPECIVDDCILFNKERMLIKSSLNLAGNQFNSDIIMLNINSFEEVWRYPIDSNLSVFWLVGDYLIVDEYYPYNIFDGVSVTRLRDKLKTRILLDSNGIAVAQSSQAYRFTAVSDISSDSFYAVSIDERVVKLLEFDMKLNLIQEILLPESIGNEGQIEIIRNENKGFLLATDYAIYDITNKNDIRRVSVEENLIKLYSNESTYYFSNDVSLNNPPGDIYVRAKHIYHKKNVKYDRLIYVIYDIANLKISAKFLADNRTRAAIPVGDTDLLTVIDDMNGVKLGWWRLYD
jgi:hypothetical protein